MALLPAFGDFFLRAARDAPRGPEVPGQTFVFVNGNDFPVFYAWAIRTAEARPCPRRVALLSSMTTAGTVVREDAATLLVRPQGGFLLRSMDRLLASPTRTFAAGERVERPDYVAEVRSLTADGRPREVAYRFRRALEDPAYRFVAVDDRARLVPFALPRVGASRALGAVTFY